MLEPTTAKQRIIAEVAYKAGHDDATRATVAMAQDYERKFTEMHKAMQLKLSVVLAQLERERGMWRIKLLRSNSGGR